MDGLKGKVILVAGATTGLGAASARRLAQEGARVVVAGRNLERAEQTAADIRATGGEAVAARFDIADDASVRDLVAVTVETCGGLDAVHVNAADMDAVQQDTDIVDMDLAVWDRTVAVNLRGHMLVSRHAIPHLLARGGGALVYTSSIASFAGERKRPAYGVTKAGINALARHVASRWGWKGVRANAIAAGPIVTPEMRDEMPPQALKAMLAGSRSDRLGEPRDVASMVAYLLSDEGSWINGQVISVDGGTVPR